MSEPSNIETKKNSDVVVPSDIRARFEAGDIFTVWEVLDKVFHFNLKYWQRNSGLKTTSGLTRWNDSKYSLS